MFLLQLQGQRRWRIGRVTDAALVPDLPLKILARFEPEHEWLLEPGDMLYLPPGWAHDGVALGECMTCSIGFRAARRGALARAVLQRLVEGMDAPAADPLYRDPGQGATSEPGRIPAALQAFASAAVARLVADPRALACALGEVLSEPAPSVDFDAFGTLAPGMSGLSLDARTRMLYDDLHVFINGESFRASGRDATLMHRLADRRLLTPREHAGLSPEARA